MERISKTANEPLYRQVEHQVRRWISDGVYQPGQRLPSIRALSAQLGVNYLTARQALSKLSAEGLLASSQGRGTFVRPVQERGSKIALVVPNLVTPLTDMIASGIYSVMKQRGIEIVLFNSYEQAEIEAENIDRVRKDRLAGAIIFSTMGSVSTWAILRLVVEGTPVVMVDRFFEDLPTWHVTADNVGGAYLATRHLIDKGCRRIAFVSDVTNSTTRYRLEGYRRALAEAGLVQHADLLGEVAPTTDDTCSVTRELVSRQPRPDGIFYGNDLRALLGVQVMKSLGVRVPEDVAVVGFDDMPMAKLCDPPLTTIRQDGAMLGQMAAELFLDQLRVPAELRRLRPQRRLLPVELVIRASSCGSAPIGLGRRLND